MATFFYNYAKGTGKDVSGAADLTGYADHADISGWATTGLAWAVDAGLITGTSATTVSPLVTANRATAARLFMLYDQKINAVHTLHH